MRASEGCSLGFPPYLTYSPAAATTTLNCIAIGKRLATVTFNGDHAQLLTDQHAEYKKAASKPHGLHPSQRLKRFMTTVFAVLASPSRPAIPDFPIFPSRVDILVRLC
jgi:hypothetical protein